MIQTKTIHFTIALYILFATSHIAAEKIAFIGCGYVGLISGAGLAEKCNHHVTCVDINKERVNQLNNGIMPIFEPQLEELTKKNASEGKLHFASDVQTVIQENDIIFITVGTPMDEEGSADLSAVYAVAKTIAENLNRYKIICIKSTVPIGTHAHIEKIIREYAPAHATYDIVSNPEFLREGSAFEDFFERNPIIIGCDSENPLYRLEQLYIPLVSKNVKVIKTDNATAEMVKYAHNCFLATRIAFVNELALLCNETGADIHSAIQIMSEGEHMYPTGRLRPGPGIGGSCLPKDTRALARNAKQYGVDLTLIETTIASNDHQKEKMISYITDLIGNPKNKTIGLLGLSFKAKTDDIRYSPAITVIDHFQKSGSKIKAYDPQAMDNMKKLFPEVEYCQNPQEACSNVDIIVVLTEWNEFKHIDLEECAARTKQKNILDARNIYNPKKLVQLGFTVKNLGRTK